MRLNRRILVRGASLLGLMLAAGWALWQVTLWAFPFPYRAEVLEAAATSGLDPRLILALARAESGFRPQAVSREGAVGLLQVTPTTAAWVASQRGLTPPGAEILADPGYNLETGAWYLAWLLGQFQGRLAPAVAAYNAGSAPVRRWLEQGTWDGTPALARRIPYRETRVFVRRVLGGYAVYRHLYPGLGPPGGGFSLRQPPSPPMPPGADHGT